MEIDNNTGDIITVYNYVDDINVDDINADNEELDSLKKLYPLNAIGV